MDQLVCVEQCKLQFYSTLPLWIIKSETICWFSERPRSTQSQGSRRSQRVQETPLKTPKKPAKNNVSFSEFSDEELTPRAERSYNESREILSSEDNTPREQPIRPEQRATVSRREEKARPSTPGAKKEPPRPPTPKIPTPRSDRSGASSRRNQVPPLEISRTRAPEETRRPVVEDRGVGSDSDDTVRGSVATAATKGSDSRCVKSFLYNENRKKWILSLAEILLMIYDFIVKIKSAYFLNIFFQRKV